jgi:hypothetical protein
MLTKLNWLIASGLAVGTLAMFVAVRANAADPPNTANSSAMSGQSGKMSPLVLPPGAVAAKEPGDSAKLSGALETATEDAITKDTGMSGILTCLVEQDRNRLKDIEKIDSTQLNTVAEQVAKAWKEKYNEPFFFDPAKVFSNIQVVQGEIADPAVFADNWPVPTVGGALGDAQQATAKIQQLDDDTRKNGFIDKGANIAVVRIPAEGNLPMLDVSLISDTFGWKIDVPNSRTAQQIHDGLERHLAMMASDTTKWPADPNQARRAFVRHVIMALYGVDTAPAPAMPAH